MGCEQRSVNITLADAVPSSSAFPTPSSSNKSNSEIQLRLGISLGLDLPAAVILSALITWLCLRRRLQGQEQIVAAYEIPMSQACNLSRLRPAEEAVQGAYVPSASSTASIEQEVVQRELDGAVFELQPELQRVEAPKDAKRAELNVHARGRSWYRKQAKEITKYYAATRLLSLGLALYASVMSLDVDGVTEKPATRS